MKTTFYTAEEMKHKIDKYLQQTIKSEFYNKMESQKNITMSEHFQNKQQIVERGKIKTPNIQIHVRSLAWLDTVT